jgi:hypothetical protein
VGVTHGGFPREEAHAPPAHGMAHRTASLERLVQHLVFRQALHLCHAHPPRRTEEGGSTTTADVVLTSQEARCVAKAGLVPIMQWLPVYACTPVWYSGEAHWLAVPASTTLHVQLPVAPCVPWPSQGVAGASGWSGSVTSGGAAS